MDQRVTTPGAPSRQSVIGLNATNFFLAEVLGVVMPFLAKFLAERRWRDDAVGLALATAGLGVFLMQTPAGFIVDRVRQRRALVVVASITLGLCYGLLPLVPAKWWTLDPLLFVSGMSGAFFAPVLGALALGLAGHAALNRTMGSNQAWNHAGNIAAALTAMVIVGWWGIASVFYAVLVVSLAAAGSVLLIRPNELDEGRASGISGDHDGREKPVGFWELMRDRPVAILFAATALFHFANAPVMPLVGLYVARLGGTDRQVAAVVLVAQTVMIPVALATGWLCDRWGRKPIFAIGFLVLPLRIFLYSLTKNPWTLVAFSRSTESEQASMASPSSPCAQDFDARQGPIQRFAGGDCDGDQRRRSDWPAVGRGSRAALGIRRRLLCVCRHRRWGRGAVCWLDARDSSLSHKATLA